MKDGPLSLHLTQEERAFVAEQNSSNLSEGSVHTASARSWSHIMSAADGSRHTTVWEDFRV